MSEAMSEAMSEGASDATPEVPPAAPPVRRRTLTLPAGPSGTARRIEVLHFGTPGARPRAYLQAGLHADELPGMLALRVAPGCPGAHRSGITKSAGDTHRHAFRDLRSGMRIQIRPTATQRPVKPTDPPHVISHGRPPSRKNVLNYARASDTAHTTSSGA